MKFNCIISPLFLAGFVPAFVNVAAILDVFKDEFGKTKWQHVANFSASVLILLLSIALIALIVFIVKVRKANVELRSIRRGLEDTVKERTENLRESNALLRESNEALEEEISEHKATSHLLLDSQNYLQSVLESMPSILIGLNQNYEITLWNKMAEEISGASAADAIGKDLWQIYPAITLSQDQLAKVLDSRKSVTIKHSQRGQYYFDMSVFPLHGDSPGLVLVIDNVTQRTLAENMLIQRDKMASMGELASSMAHDINIPLEGILRDVESVQSQLAQSGGGFESIQTLLSDAVERGHQAGAVIANLLEFARTKGGEKKPIAPADLIEKSLRLARDVLVEPSGLKFREIRVEKILAPELPELHCYAAELQQVFLGLFRHSLHAISLKGLSAREARLRIEAYESDGSLWLKVQHNGRGLDAEEQLDIFEPFFSSVSTIKPKEIDTSNRLSFSHFIVTEQHKGQMAVTSDLNAGTTFHMQFLLSGE